MGAKPKKSGRSNSRSQQKPGGLISRAKLNVVALAGFMIVFAGVGMTVYQASFAASTSEPEIESGITGQCLDNYNDTSAQNNPVDIWHCNGTLAQRWSIVGGDTVQIHGLCMQPYNDGKTQSTPIVTATCTTDHANYWTIANDTMVNQASGLCLDDPSPTGTNGTQLVLGNCNKSSAQVWTAATWYPATPTPTASVQATPVMPTSSPAPATPQTRASTPVPAKASTNKPTASSGGTAKPSANSASSGVSQKAPDAPGNFSARVSGSNAVVELSWTDPSDATGIAGYELDRSVDQISWSPVAASLKADGYEDSSVGFSVHYFYRIQATDNAGLKSPYALADATTPPFQSNASQSTNSTYTSDDGLATVNIPGGALSDSADCSINMSASNDVIPFGKSLTEGPYALVCKDAGGSVISRFLQPLKWTINLKGKLAHLSGPSIYAANSKGHLAAVTGAKYNSQTGTVTFQTTTNQAVLALAATTPDISLITMAEALLAMAAVAGIGFVILNTKQKRSFNDYLRSKYTKKRS